MKHAVIAAIASFSLGLAASAFAHTPSAAPAPGVSPAGESCKAAGQPCTDREDCYSRMCRKDTKKCS